MSVTTSGNTLGITFQAKVDDFNEQHELKTKRQRAGRHPRSFGRGGELWAYASKSNERVDNIRRGHSFWTILDHSEQSMIKDNNKMTQKAIEAAESGVQRYAEEELRRPTKDIYLNGWRLDLNTIVQLHYGMSIALVNDINQVICVDKNKELMVKNLKEIEPEDLACWKLLDIAETTNPSAITYGCPVWLQLIEPSLYHNVDESWKLGYVLGGKLFGPPLMGEIQIDETGGSGDNIELLDVGPSESGPGAYVNNGKHFNTANMQEEDEINSIIAAKQKQKSPDGKNNGEHEDTEQDSRSPFTKKIEANSEIVGAVFPTRIVNVKNDDDEDEANGKNSTRRCKEASHLGQWGIESARRKDVQLPTSKSIADPELIRQADNFVYSCEPVYINQDISCIASTQGTDYQQWPRRGLNRATLDKKKELRANGLNLTSQELAQLLTQMTMAGKLNVESVDDPPVSSRACMRRIVRRGAPHEYGVDRRAVWRIYVVEAPGDHSNMSAKEITAAKIMQDARNVLAESSAFRGGSTTYKVDHTEVKRSKGNRSLNNFPNKNNDASDATTATGMNESYYSAFDSSIANESIASQKWRETINESQAIKLDLPKVPHSLLSGESFPSSLATINSRTSFILEVNSLEDRRAKESHVGDYLRHLVSTSITEESQVLDKMARDLRNKGRNSNNRNGFGFGSNNSMNQGDDSTVGLGGLDSMSQITSDIALNDDASAYASDSITAAESQERSALGSSRMSRNNMSGKKLDLKLVPESKEAYGGKLIEQHRHLASMGVRALHQYNLVTKTTAEGAAGRDGHIQIEEKRVSDIRSRLQDKLDKLNSTDAEIKLALVHRERMKQVAKVASMFNS